MRINSLGARDALPITRRIKGALPLAMIFATGVAFIELAWALLTSQWNMGVNDLLFVARWGAFAFTLSFLLLGLARLTGLLALVVLVSLLWIWQVFVVHLGEVEPSDFVGWTLFAAPLLVMVSHVVRHVPPRGARQWNRWTGWALMACWAVVAFVGMELDRRPSWLPHVTWIAMAAVWMALPPLLTVRTFLRVRGRWPVRTLTPNLK